jgi:AcrR family transcriptional regulator
MSTSPKTPTADPRRGGLSRQTIRDAAILRFAEQGYHGTSLREIATDLDVTVAAIYYYYPSKEELLTDVVETGLHADFEAVAQLRAPGNGLILDDLIRLHVRRHIELRDEALVVHHEARHLPQPYLERVRTLLREYESVFRDAIVLECDIAPGRLSMITKVILGMGSGVIDWFRPHELLTADQVADLYVLYTRGVINAEVNATVGNL